MNRDQQLVEIALKELRLIRGAIDGLIDVLAEIAIRHVDFPQQQAETKP